MTKRPRTSSGILPMALGLGALVMAAAGLALARSEAPSLAGATPQERARKLRLVNGDLVAELVPFTFSLQADATDTPQLRRVVWTWDAAVGRWGLRQPAMP